MNVKKKIHLISLIFFLIDLLTKTLILTFENHLPITVINNFFYIDKITNEGAAFSILNGHTIIFIIIAIIMLIYIDRNLLKDVKTKLDIISYSLLIGGIVGNLFDRIFYKEVIDFLSFNIFGYMFPVFNLADTFICIGIFIIIIKLLKGEKNEISSTRK